MTGEHLTLGQIEDYTGKRLPAEQIPVFRAHAETCPSCGDLLLASLAGSAANHLTESQAVDFVAGLLAAGEESQAASHIATCAPCAAMVADIEEFRPKFLGQKS